MTKTFYDLLPDTAPFRPRRYKSCSVVGNGGILLKSGCGRDIDAADFVFSEDNVERLSNLLTERRGELSVQPLFTPNSVFDKVERFWREQSGYELSEARVSSGLYLVTLALSICQQVTVYGFYPSHVSPWKSYLRYHYYSPYSFFSFKQIGPWGIHDMGRSSPYWKTFTAVM
ncbi:ST8SIA1 [Branchiostoma lanceolatum]|uniref:ST8SIA1 protein n=1 Tax=Branchiostoma lanceolatum TaxID=7740 RepID=A0A8J9ZEY2_BRALA|nr:ST8SIA1 [Branchiostoma lanceolatum]